MYNYKWCDYTEDKLWIKNHRNWRNKIWKHGKENTLVLQTLKE